ncbi:MAG TPA: hypothetical protein VF173_36685 [Thermoanaerobaculia bacterium]|nr:hypothetical protein [Thermoanaerobaculia bacterium]
MIPSPLAALTYAAIKVVGYAEFARGLNKVADKHVPPYLFGTAKTALGLIGGITYVFIVDSVLAPRERSEIALFLGAAPVRLLVWSLALGFFYGFRERPKLVCAAVALGTVWSYALDGLMWLIDKNVPGMAMPFC